MHERGTLDVDQVRALAGLGDSGAHPGNVWRDLKNKLPKCKLSLHTFQFPLRNSIVGLFSKPLHMFLPHELISGIYHHYPDMFRTLLYGSEAVCRKFWNSVRGGAHFLSHPVRTRLNHATKCIPLRLHGDGTPVTGLGKAWGKMMDCYSISSLLVSGPTNIFYFLIWIVYQKVLSKVDHHNTMATFFRRLKWSCDALWSGEHPERCPDGKPIRSAKAGTSLMGDFFACIWVVASDCEHHTSVYLLPNASSNNPCMCCPANVTTLKWWDFRLDADWIDHIYTLLTWQASGFDKCLLFQIVGVTVFSLYPDWMHCKHLGIDKVLLGSVLWMLIHWVMGGLDADANMKIVWLAVPACAQLR